MSVLAGNVDEQGIPVVLDSDTVQRIAFFLQAPHGTTTHDTSHE
jgi:hypothetical protein